ncbi:MAG TPA: RNA-binding protein [Aliidongia sp.]|nr:RNA-binding protein [Aliidongia sp.]
MRPVPFKGNLIVTNLPDDMTAPRLADLFEEYGIVIGAEIRQIPANAGPATIGVVALAPDGAVEKAISAVDKSMIGQRKIKVGRAKPPAPKQKGAAKPATAAARPVPVPSEPAAPAPVVAPRPYVAEAYDGNLAAPAPKKARAVVVEYKNRRIIRP